MLITLGKHRFPNYSMWNRLFDRLTKMDIFGSYSYRYSAGQHTTKFMKTTFFSAFPELMLWKNSKTRSFMNDRRRQMCTQSPFSGALGHASSD